jgi:hypothetical protein
VEKESCPDFGLPETFGNLKVGKLESWKVGKLRTQDSKNTGMDLASI